MPRVNDLPTVNVTAGYPTAFTSADEVVALQSGVVVKGAMSLLGSILTFDPSGTGAIARTVETALRTLVRSGDYNTAVNYETALAALTETIGMAKIDVGPRTG